MKPVRNFEFQNIGNMNFQDFMKVIDRASQDDVRESGKFVLKIFKGCKK